MWVYSSARESTGGRARELGEQGELVGAQVKHQLTMPARGGWRGIVGV